MVAPRKGRGGLLMSTPPHLLTRMPFHSFIISHLKECISKLITSKLNLSQTTIQYAVHFQPASLVFLFVVVLNEGIYITSELLKWIDFVCLKKKKKSEIGMKRCCLPVSRSLSETNVLGEWNKGSLENVMLLMHSA